MSTTLFAVNLGGEGEVPGALNQQPPFALGPKWLSQSQQTLAQLTAAGIPFLICPNDAVALPDGSVDVVHTNNVPIDTPPHPLFGPGVQSSEIRRILKPGGRWVHDVGQPGERIWVKPL